MSMSTMPTPKTVLGHTEKEIKRKQKKQMGITQVTLPGFVPEVRYSPLSNEDNDNDSGIDQEEESLDNISLGSFENEEFPFDFDVDLRPRTVKLGFNFIDFQKFTKMPFGPFKKKDSIKKEEEKPAEEKKTEETKEEVKNDNKTAETKVDEKNEKNKEENKKDENKKDETVGTTKEENEKTAPDADGEVKENGKMTLEIKDIGGGKLGKSEGSPLLQSEAPQPMLCCTIL